MSAKKVAKKEANTVESIEVITDDKPISAEPQKYVISPGHRVDVIHVDTRWIGHHQVMRYAIRPICESAGRDGAHSFCPACTKEYKNYDLFDSEADARAAADFWNSHLPEETVNNNLISFKIGIER